MSTKTQLKKIKALVQCVKNCQVFEDTPKEYIRIIPTGDGMCIAFLQGVDLPLQLAIQLQEKLQEYNQGKIPSEIIKIRVGLHSGACFTFDDIAGNTNVWGPGIIISKRIMDLGDDGHILLSSAMAETLQSLSDEYRQMIKPVRDYSLKHNIIMLIYSAYGKNFGNPISPKKHDVQQSKMQDEIRKLQNTTLYPGLKTELFLMDDKTMKVHHKRIYDIANKSNEPIKFVLHGIATDVEKDSLNDFNIKVYDNSLKEMKISSINLDKPFCKEFSTVFHKPVMKNEDRSYTLEYDIEEPKRFYENAFLIDCKKFILSFIYPEGASIKTPVFYEVNQETDTKKKSAIEPLVEQDKDQVRMTWEKEDAMKGQTFRIEW